MNETLFRISSNSLLLNIEFIAAVWTSPQKERAASCRSVFWAFEHSHTVDIGLKIDQTAWIRRPGFSVYVHSVWRMTNTIVHCTSTCTMTAVSNMTSAAPAMYGVGGGTRGARRTEPGHTYTRFHRSFDFALTTLAVRVLKNQPE